MIIATTVKTIMFTLCFAYAFALVYLMGVIAARPTSTSTEVEHTNLETPAHNRVYPALEVRFVDSLSSSSYRKYPTTQSKRNCKYNLGLSQDCDYRDAAQAALRRRYVQSNLSPGKK
ncbi:uncharacterized protein LOC129590164 [Paramacrobiotus metropolitanus]|uniref:uncharacterized protein LOC129590164 n=1 Tax=Paramacrobiotus metropolitanus TaxID=2943436 RepID=UPI00244581F4|nr:uncharacterized protein LOC129590164 [Paramacrobiotus metropolitanus]